MFWNRRTCRAKELVSFCTSLPPEKLMFYPPPRWLSSSDASSAIFAYSFVLKFMINCVAFIPDCKQDYSSTPSSPGPLLHSETRKETRSRANHHPFFIVFLGDVPLLLTSDVRLWVRLRDESESGLGLRGPTDQWNRINLNFKVFIKLSYSFDVPEEGVPFYGFRWVPCSSNNRLSGLHVFVSRPASQSSLIL